MAFTDSDFVKINLPANASFSVNGVTMSVDDAVANALEETGSRAGALAMLYRIAEQDQLKSETIGKYSYERWGMPGSAYWEIQLAGVGMGSAAPNVVMRPSTFGAQGVLP